MVFWQHAWYATNGPGFFGPCASAPGLEALAGVSGKLAAGGVTTVPWAPWGEGLGKACRMRA